MSETSVRHLKQIDPAQPVPFTGLFILRRRTVKTARNGNTFLSVELGDRTGAFSANCFGDAPAFAALESVPEGSIVRVSGTTDYWQDRFSPKIAAAETVDPAEAGQSGAMENLVETCPEDPEALWAEVSGIAAAIAHEGLRETVRRVLEEHEAAFRTSPAAISMHHAYRHGLLEHTTHMARAARALLPLYPEVDADLSLAGVILHDIGKIEEYEGDFAARTSRAGILQGHVVLGFRMVRKAALQSHLGADLLERLEHIILSHQGEKEWGAAAMAATPEAVFVSMIDNLDAKMGMVQRALRNSASGEAFSEYLNGLSAPVLVAPPDKD